MNGRHYHHKRHLHYIEAEYKNGQLVGFIPRYSWDNKEYTQDEWCYDRLSMDELVVMVETIKVKNTPSEDDQAEYDNIRGMKNG